MTKNEVIQIALEFVDSVHEGEWPPHDFTRLELIEELRAALAQPEPEPVAWAYKVNNTWEQLSFIEPPNDAYDDDSLVPLYTAPPQRKPLSDDELLAALKSVDSETARLPNGFKLFARAIEAAHGIRKKK